MYNISFFARTIQTYRSSVTNLVKLPRNEIEAFLDSFDTVLTDCDGVLWLGDEALHNSPEVLNRLREIGKRIFYVTNNSTKIRDEYVTKATKLRYKATKDEIISTAYLAAEYLKSRDFDKKVYVIGSKGITQELDLIGIKHTDIGPEIMEKNVRDYVHTLQLDKDVGAVIIGFDQHFSYPKIIRAASYLKRPHSLFIVTNPDEQIPMGSVVIVPGTGSTVKSVECASDRKAFCVGKPYSYISEHIMKVHKVDPKRTLMIGDRCNTDILMGTRCGFQTLLVLTGISTLNQVNVWKQSNLQNELDLVPDFYLKKLGDLLQFL